MIDTLHTALVACAASKLAEPREARDLYVSTLFFEARRFAERNADKWYVLSALHGLLEPSLVIPPYECTLNDMSAVERRRWAVRVNQRLLEVLSPGQRVTILAGKRYREFVEPFLRARGCDVHVPLTNFRIGKQIQWLQRANAGKPVSPRD